MKANGPWSCIVGSLFPSHRHVRKFETLGDSIDRWISLDRFCTVARLMVFDVQISVGPSHSHSHSPSLSLSFSVLHQQLPSVWDLDELLDSIIIDIIFRLVSINANRSDISTNSSPPQGRLLNGRFFTQIRGICVYLMAVLRVSRSTIGPRGLIFPPCKSPPDRGDELVTIPLARGYRDSDIFPRFDWC